MRGDFFRQAADGGDGVGDALPSFAFEAIAHIAMGFGMAHRHAFRVAAIQTDHGLSQLLFGAVAQPNPPVSPVNITLAGQDKLCDKYERVKMKFSQSAWPLGPWRVWGL